MNIYIMWSDWDEANIEVFSDTVEGCEKAQDRIVELKKLDNNTTVNKVIRGIEMDIENVEIVTGVKLTIKKN